MRFRRGTGRGLFTGAPWRAGLFPAGLFPEGLLSEGLFTYGLASWRSSTRNGVPSIPQGLAQRALEITPVGLGQGRAAMPVHHDARRVVAAEMRVTELDAPARDERRGMVQDGALQDAGQHPGLDLYEGRGMGSIDGREEPPDTAAVQGRDVMDPGEIQEREPPVHLLVDMVALLGG